MRRRGQGTFEYVLLLGGVLLVVVLAIVVLQGAFKQSSQDLSADHAIALKQCKAVAVQELSCSPGGAFDPTATFSKAAFQIPEGTLCDCSNYNPDAQDGGEQQAEFSNGVSTLLFDDGSAPQAPEDTNTRLSLRRRGDKVWFVIQHRVDVAYSGPLTVVLPVSIDKVASVFPSTARMSASGDGASTLLSWDNLRLSAGQRFIVVAYLKKNVDFATLKLEIPATVSAIAAAKPTAMPSGFSEFVRPAPLAQSAPSCLLSGQSCANPLGPACCNGLSCDVLSGLTCKPPTLTPTPTPTSTPSPSPTPTLAPAPTLQATLPPASTALPTESPSVSADLPLPSVSVSPTSVPSVAPVSPLKVTLTLYYGWNFISVPLLDASYVGGSCAFGGERENPAWHFNGEAYGSAGKFSDSSIRLEAGKGYWVNSASKTPCTAEFSGQPLDAFTALALRGGGNPPISFRGWNMVGGLSSEASLGQVLGDCKAMTELFEYVPADGTYRKGTRLEPGKGYWVFMEKDCSLRGSPASAAGSPIALPAAQTPELPVLPSVVPVTPSPSSVPSLSPTVAPLPACVPSGQGCGMLIGSTACCSGLTCQFDLSSLSSSCKADSSSPAPSPSPIALPSSTVLPTSVPTILPTVVPTEIPTPIPASSPLPTSAPTSVPAPSLGPTLTAVPTAIPNPSSLPSPTSSPTVTATPTAVPVALKDCRQPVVFNFQSTNPHDGYCGQWNGGAARYENRWNFLSGEVAYSLPAGASDARIYVNDYGAYHGSRLSLRINGVGLDNENPSDANYNFPTTTAWIAGVFHCGWSEHAYPYKEVPLPDNRLFVQFFDASAGGAKGAFLTGGFKGELRFKAATCPSGELALTGTPAASPSPSPAPSPSATPSPSPSARPTITPTPTPTPIPIPTATAIPTIAPVAAFDTLTFSTGSQSFPTSATDTSTVDLSYVLVQSSLTSPFDFGTVQAKEFYYVTDAKPAGKAVQGILFYRDPTTSFFVPYVNPDGIRNPLSGSIAINVVKYSYGAQGSQITFNAAGIESGLNDPDFDDFVIRVPDGPNGPEFQIDVGYGDQSTPRLGSSSQSGVAYG